MWSVCAKRLTSSRARASRRLNLVMETDHVNKLFQWKSTFMKSGTALPSHIEHQMENRFEIQECAQTYDILHYYHFQNSTQERPKEAEQRPDATADKPNTQHKGHIPVHTEQ